jgi:hypothetical protein
MRLLLVLAMSLGTLEVAHARDNVLYIKSCQVTLSPDWTIASHVPNGKEISMVTVVLTDSSGQAPADNSIVIYGFCDVSTHAGLTRKQLITGTPESKTARQIGDWQVSYAVSAKRTNFGLAIDAFRYLPDRKAYLWVRRGRMVKTKDYTPAEADYTEFATYLKRITEVKTP